MPVGKVRSTFPPVGSPTQGLIVIKGSFLVGAAGAVGAMSNGEGIDSITRDSEGVYTFALEDRYRALVDAGLKFMAPSLENIHGQLKSYDLAAKTLTFQCYEVDGSGTPQVEDPEEDDVVFFEITVQAVSPGARA